MHSRPLSLHAPSHPRRARPGENMFLCAVAKRAGSEGRDNHAVIRYLVDMFGPRLILTPQQKRLSRYERPSLYEGKSPLHQAILSHDVKMVQFFVERGADVKARCIGSFFGAASHAYYGEYPLSFAVCTGQAEVVRYLAENGSKVSEGRCAQRCCCKYARHAWAADSEISDLGHARPLGAVFSLSAPCPPPSGAQVDEDHDVHCSYALHMAVMSDRIASARTGGLKS